MSRIREQNEKGELGLGGGGGMMDRKQQPWQKGKERLDGRREGKWQKGGKDGESLT